MTEPPLVTFASLLRRLRTEAGLTQEELAAAAGLSARSVSDLERGVAQTARKETARLLAEALDLTVMERESFLAVARGRALSGIHSAPVTWAARPQAAPVSSPVSAGGRSGAVVAREDVAGTGWPSDDPQSWQALVVAALDERGVAAARAVVAEWRARQRPDDESLDWVETLIRLTAEGRLSPATHRPVPSADQTPLFGRERQVADLNDFVDRVQRGRGGLALVLGPAGIGKSRLLSEVLAGREASIAIEWVTFDRGETGYRGCRRLLAPTWITLRRIKLAPAGLVAHAGALDALLLGAGDRDLAGKLFPGEVTAAVAALLDHVTDGKPMLLVIDDAHRGGASSDRLLLDVARHVNARFTGLVAALRPDELDDDSPIRHYADQPGERAALDVVVPIRLPSLDLAATARLLQARTGVQLPIQVVEQVLQATAGRPQLIQNTQIHLSLSVAREATWVAGKLMPEGLRVLDSTISSRGSDERAILQAAAMCAADGLIEPDTVASVTGRPADLVEGVLDQERRRGPILVPRAAEYRFQHDNWIDALVESCPPARRRELHARCLAVLRADPAYDPRRLARHALGAGAAIVGVEEIVALARQASDQAFADYAFGDAAEFFDVAARHAAGPERIELLIGEADALRHAGRWDQARVVLRQAIALARTAGMAGEEVRALMHLDRVTWSFGLDERDLTQRLRHLIGLLPPGETALRALAQAALGSRLGIAARQYRDEQAILARAALSQLPAVTDTLARADILYGARCGLQDNATPEELLALDRQLLEHGTSVRSVFHINEALTCQVVDLIRAGQLADLQSAVRTLRQFADQSQAAEAIYARELIAAMLCLARGEFRATEQHTAELARVSEPWGQSMIRETLVALAGWLLLETGRLAELTEVLEGQSGQDVSTLNEPVWSLATGLVRAEAGDAEPAARVLQAVCAGTGEFADLPRGPGRIGTLAIAAALAGHPALSESLPRDWAIRVGHRLADLLTAHGDQFVIVGWPTLLTGSKQRHIGLAYLAAREPAKATAHLARAAQENQDFAALHARTRFDLARALLSQAGSHAEGKAELGQAKRAAAALGMTRLAELAEIAEALT